MKKEKLITISQSEDSNYNVKDLNISEIVPNEVDGFIVTILDNHHTIMLPPNITGMQFKSWRNGKGGIFSKDVLNFSLNKYHAKYLHLTGPDINCIIRLVSEEEEESFTALNFVDGKIKDKPYTIIRQIGDDNILTSTHKYINENDVVHEEMFILSKSEKNTQEDDFEQHVNSISLFNE